MALPLYFVSFPLILYKDNYKFVHTMQYLLMEYYSLQLSICVQDAKYSDNKSKIYKCYLDGKKNLTILHFL